MDTVHEKNRRSTSAPCECDTISAPLESAFLTADEVGELVYTFSSKRVVGGGGAKNGAARQCNFSPAIVVTLHRGGYLTTTTRAFSSRASACRALLRAALLCATFSSTTSSRGRALLR